jgi:hypothetical protein
MRAQTLILSRRIRGLEGYGGRHMIQPKRICGIGAIAFLILLPMALATHVLPSPGASLAPVNATHDQGLSQAWFLGRDTGEAHSSVMVCALAIDPTIAQSNIPNVLVPSTIPSAEPSLPTASPTPQTSARLSAAFRPTSSSHLFRFFLSSEPCFISFSWAIKIAELQATKKRQTFNSPMHAKIRGGESSSKPRSNNFTVALDR